MRRILKLLCLCSLFFVAIPPLWAESLTPAPLNPAFVEYQQQAAKMVASGETLHLTGRTPSPVDLSHLAGKSLLPAEGMKAAAEPPARYDLRDERFVSPVRNQSPYGACWTFAAMASMESTAMKLLGAENPDLAEWNLAYYGYIDESDELVGFGDYTWADFPETADCGGDDFKATAILSRWTGPAWESVVPYGTTPFTTGAECAYHLSDVMFLYLDQSSRYAPVNRENLKYALMNYGVVSVGVAAGNGLYNPLYWNEMTSASYIPLDNTDGLEVGCADHAVAIVGWDDDYSRDNFATTPPGDGAWIVRNSWGTNWGDEGYFYLSYYDAVLDTGAAYISAPADNYDHIYQHDPLGLVGMQGIPGDLTPTTAWMANVFTAEGVQALTAVAFYAPAVDSTYELSIFTGVNGDPTSGALALHAQTGTLHEPGYRTVELESPVLLTAGQTFSVVVKLNTPGYNYPLAAEGRMEGYSDKATASPGESFFSNDGISWTDTTNENTTANLCIKAFTSDLKLEARQGETLPPVASETLANAAFSDFQEDLDAVSDDILALLGNGAAAGTLQVIGQSPLEFRCGNVPAPLTVSFDQALTRNDSVIESALLLAYNHQTGRYEPPAMTGDLSAQALSASREASFTDGGPFDEDGTENGTLTDLKLMEILVQAEFEETPAGSGGGCHLGNFAPAALLLLIPLTFLKKR